ncbi:hypothetical protein ES708_24391 [subsurface metagenome]
MATRYEYYITGDDKAFQIWGATWLAQTFTPSSPHNITSVKLKLYRYGSPGTITVSIRATDGSGHPTGPDLCFQTMNGLALIDWSPGEWYEFFFGTNPKLSSGIKYAIVVRAPSGDVSNHLRWRYDDTSPTYAGGIIEVSYDSGSSWAGATYDDFMFEEWGDLIVTAPTVTTQAVSSIGTTTATGNGNITDLGYENCSKRGICWNTSPNPTIANDKSEETDSFGTGAFSRPMTGLTPGQHYYVRAYAYNSAGYGYGAQVEFTTLELPTVTTQAVSDIAATTATGHGNIVDAGVPNCDKRGVCWNTTGNPTVADDKSEEADGFGAGAFSRPMTGLTPEQHYYVKAYAYNSAGYGYGGQVEFDTLPLTQKEVSDTGSGADATPSIEVALGLADTGEGVEAIPGMSPDIPTIEEAGAGIDKILGEFTKDIEEAGAGIDKILGEFTKDIEEAGSGYDAVNVNYYVSFINVGDVGSGADVISLAITIPTIEDSGVGVEAILGEYTKFVKERMYSSEYIVPVVASMILSELAAGEDAIAIQITPIIAETGEGLESVVIAASLSVAEAGSGVDAPSVTVTLTIPEVGAGVDSALAAISITIADTGEGIEAILRRVVELARLFIMTRSKTRMKVKTTHKSRIKLKFRGGGER